MFVRAHLLSPSHPSFPFLSYFSSGFLHILLFVAESNEHKDSDDTKDDEAFDDFAADLLVLEGEGDDVGDESTDDDREIYHVPHVTSREEDARTGEGNGSG